MTNDNLTPLQHKTLNWFITDDIGESSKTMAYWLAFGKVYDYGDNIPLDPDDLDRCLQLLHVVPEMRPLLPRMIAFKKWRPLVDRWDEVEKSHLDEVGLGWTTAQSAPKTYALMKSILR